MIKVMIVDDEPLSRLELVNMIPWRKYDYLMVGTAENGKLGLELAGTTQPDIVIVDIKMPVMDGLEMMRRLQETQPEVQFIVLTGYAEFHFAQEALRLGAVDYVMKLKLDPEQLLAILEKIRTRMAFSNLNRRIITDGGARQERLIHLIDGWYHGNDERDECSLVPLGVNQIARIDVFSTVTGKLCVSDERDAVMDIISEILRRFRNDGIVSESLCHAPHRYTLLLRVGENCPPDTLTTIAEMLRKMLYKCLDMDMHFGLSDRNPTERMSKCARQAELRCDMGFWYEKGVDIFRDVRRLAQDGIPYPHAEEKALLDMIRDGTAEEIKRHVLCYTQSLSREPMYTKTECCDMVERLAYNIGRGIAFYLGADTILFDYAMESRQIADYALFARMVDGFAEYCDRLHNLILRCGKGQGNALGDALRYMRANYSRPIKLSEVAHIASMNPTYFCTLFKKNTGQSFSNYLNALRIEKAKELLIRGDLNISEISDRVGFENSAYFAKVFKQFAGVQPIGYRKRNE